MSQIKVTEIYEADMAVGKPILSRYPASSLTQHSLFGPRGAWEWTVFRIVHVAYFKLFFSYATTYISVYTKLLLMSKCGQSCYTDAEFVLIVCFSR